MAGEIIVDKITAGAGYSFLPVLESGGRLTLTANTPVMNANVSNTNIVYYAPYKHSYVMTFNGANLVPVLISSPQLSINIVANVANTGPAATTANNNYDLFVWNNNGTLTLSLGPAWQSANTRGSNTTLNRANSNGLLTNNLAIVNGPPANQGTYLGTISTNTFGNVDWNLGGSAAGGLPATLNIWNMYNRIKVICGPSDSTGGWTYATNTWRQADGSNGNRVSFIQGLLEDSFVCRHASSISNNAAAANAARGGIGISIDATDGSNPSNVFYQTAWFAKNDSTFGQATIIAIAQGQLLGFHYAQAIENVSSGTIQYRGADGQVLSFEGMF